jgi:hypothetical protein
MSVATVDGVRLQDECPGPVTRSVISRYWDLHSNPAYTIDVDA